MKEPSSESRTDESRVELGAPIPYLRHVKRVIVTVIGFTVLIIGFFGIVLPLVPAFILIPAGLAILATEFVWARRWVKKAKAMFQREQGGDSSSDSGGSETTGRKA